MINKFIALILILSSQLVLLADTRADSVDEMVLSMSQRLADLKLLNESIVRGGLRVRLCQYCHGKDGNSVKNDIPNLAQQNPAYLLTQFEYFRLDKRKNNVMNRLAKGLSKDERINIALYYASKEVKNNKAYPAVDKKVISRGTKLYNNTCVQCHGKKGYGERSLPRLAGQQYDFLIKTLSNYKNKKGVRPDSPMIGVSSGLSEEDIVALASYVTRLD